MAEDQIDTETAAEKDLGPARQRTAAAMVPPTLLRLLGRTPPWLLMALGVVLLVTVIVGTVVPFAVGWLDQDDLETLGYPGIFLANFLGTATVFVPVPGLTAAGQALIIAGADKWNPVVVVVAGSAGMTLAESTAYLAGMVGREVAEEMAEEMAEERPRRRARLARWLGQAAGWVDRLMARYGFATLLVLSAVPNPLFEFAGITAGAVRMNFWRFLLAVAIGKTTRAILLVIIGQRLLDLFSKG